jgi:serine/threonine protein kinase
MSDDRVPETADNITDRIGPYRVLDRIGEGRMGVVFLARCPEGRFVAIKVLGQGVIDDPTTRMRLFREIETMRRVRSVNVAEIFDADVASAMPWIVTSYVPGGTLEEVINDQGPLRGAALARLAGGLANALTAIHGAGVVHRDLKPGNVILRNADPVVIDFGIAQGADSTRLTATGLVTGTPGYMSPEVIMGDNMSPASDVYSWGATVAFAASGHPTFGTGSYHAICHRSLKGAGDFNGVPLSLRPVLGAALDPEARRRPTADELRRHIAALDLAALERPPIR